LHLAKKLAHVTNQRSGPQEAGSLASDSSSSKKRFGFSVEQVSRSTDADLLDHPLRGVGNLIPSRDQADKYVLAGRQVHFEVGVRTR
jgi:hypothetical protein